MISTMREDDDDDEVYVKRRINTTLPKKNRTPWKRQSHNEGLNYSSTNKKGKKLTQKQKRQRSGTVCYRSNDVIYI